MPTKTKTVNRIHPTTGAVYSKTDLDGMGIGRDTRAALIREGVIVPIQVGRRVWYSGAHLVAHIERKTDERLAARASGEPDALKLHEDDEA